MMAASLNTPNPPPNPLLGGTGVPRQQIPGGFGHTFPGVPALPAYPTSYPYYPLSNPATGMTPGDLSHVATNSK